MADKDFKFFYLDNENEVISITSQADLTEALNIEDLSSIKLTVASNMQEAIKILHASMMESASIAESINQSQYGGGSCARRSRANSEFDQIKMHSPAVGMNHANTGSKKKDRPATVADLLKPDVVADDNSSSHRSSHLGGEGQEMIVGMKMQG